MQDYKRLRDLDLNGDRRIDETDLEIAKTFLDRPPGRSWTRTVMGRPTASTRVSSLLPGRERSSQAARPRT
jgi:hypothetical protein